MPKTWWFEARDGRPEKMKRQLNYFIHVGVLKRPSFLSEVVRLPKKLDLRKTPFLKECRNVGNHVVFSSMYSTKFSTKGLLAVV